MIKDIIKRFLLYVIKGVPVYKVYPQITNLNSNDLLLNRVALITGGASGIGFSIAKSFLASGAYVVISGRNKEKLKKAKQLLCQDYPTERVMTVVLDMQKVETFSDVFNSIIEKLNGKKLDILVNNAGVLGCQLKNAEENSYDSALDTNLKGPFFLSKIVAEYMKANNIKGNILNVASSSSFRPAACAYTISKWGMRGFTLGLAKSLIPYDIVVNGIAPGPTVTPMTKNTEDGDYYLANNPTKRYATSLEIANMATILVSNMCRTVVGDILCMTGGAGVITFDDINYNF